MGTAAGKWDDSMRTGKTRKEREAEMFGKYIDEKRYEADKSTIAILMGHFFLRYLNLLYEEFDGDLILPIVLGEIAHHNIVRYFSRDGNCAAIRDQVETSRKLGKVLEPTNAYSISEATGIPRETVRRKIDKLVIKGWLVKSSRGDVTMSNTVADHFIKDFNKKLLIELFDTSECIKRLLKSESQPAQFD